MSSPAEIVVDARALTKRYDDDRIAVDGIDFVVRRGECLGFLGPNGAGKSTVMRMLYGFTPRTSGELTVFGMDVARNPRLIKARLGVVPQDNNLDPDNTVWQNLLIYARYFRLPRKVAIERAQVALDLFALGDRRDSEISELSGGMKRRLVMARALMGDPELVLLDEPTTGLDPQARRVVWRTLREMRRQGRTLVLTTHYLDEAERLCDRLILVDHGRVILEGRPAELIAEHAGGVVFEADLTDVAADGAPAQLPAVTTAAMASTGLDHVYESGTLTVYGAGQDPAGVEAAFARIPLPAGTTHVVRRGTLEDVFLRITGHALAEDE
ncbi:MAG: transporter [Thermoleophilia bacterium]|nr:transporter [Thermoleophilia bacterium]MCZ4496822.1 transporter [Thermoleophilia bacterium]